MSKPDLSDPIQSMFSTVNQKPQARVEQPATKIQQQKPVVTTNKTETKQVQNAEFDLNIIFSAERLDEHRRKNNDKTPSQTLTMHPDMSEWLIDKGREVSIAIGSKDANRSSLSRYAIYKIMNDGIDHEDFKSFIRKDPMSRSNKK